MEGLVDEKKKPDAALGETTLSRRGFVMLSLAAGLVAMASNAKAALTNTETAVNAKQRRRACGRGKRRCRR